MKKPVTPDERAMYESRIAVLTQAAEGFEAKASLLAAKARAYRRTTEDYYLLLHEGEGRKVRRSARGGSR